MTRRNPTRPFLVTVTYRTVAMTREDATTFAAQLRSLVSDFRRGDVLGLQVNFTQEASPEETRQARAKGLAL